MGRRRDITLMEVDSLDCGDLCMDTPVMDLIDSPVEQARFLDIHAIMIDNEVAGRRFFNADNEQKQLEALLPGLPGESEVYKIIGGRRGFSCIGLIEYIANREPVEEMLMTTFRCETKQMMQLDRMHDEGKLNYVEMIVSRMARNEKRGYFKECLDISAKNGWFFGWAQNHSKVALLKTAQNYYVFETSANLNENPRLEQYSLENSKEVWDFYRPMILGLKEVEEANIMA